MTLRHVSSLEKGLLIRVDEGSFWTLMDLRWEQNMIGLDLYNVETQAKAFHRFLPHDMVEVYIRL